MSVGANPDSQQPDAVTGHQPARWRGAGAQAVGTADVRADPGGGDARADPGTGDAWADPGTRGSWAGGSEFLTASAGVGLGGSGDEKSLLPPDQSLSRTRSMAATRAATAVSGACITIVAGYQILAGSAIALPGLLAIGPVIAAVWAGPRAVTVLGGYSLGLAALVSWANNQWWTSTLIATGLAIVAATAVALVLAARRVAVERYDASAAYRWRVLGTLVDDCDDAVIGTTVDGTIASWNAGATRMYGYAAAEAAGRPISIVMDRTHPGELPEMLTRIIRGERVDHYLARRLRKDGVVLDVSVALSPVRDGDGRLIGICAIDRDVSAERRDEIERRAQTERWQQSQRLDSLGQLAGGVAHDFNNMLTVILSHSEFAADQVTDAEVRTDIERIHSAAERAAALTRQLLTFARGEGGRAEVLDLNDVVAAARSRLARTVGDEIDVVVVPAPEPLTVRADRHQLEHVLTNLAVNARDAMPEGGMLLVETQIAELEPDHTGIQPAPRGGRYARLLVSDTGIGMTRDTIDRIFEPFFTTKSRGHGTGLGLAAVYGIVTEAGGSLNVYSEPGLGTTIRVYLPSYTDALTPPPPEHTGELAPGHNETVLVVEDDDAVRNLIGRVLRGNGFRVIEAATGREALALAAAQRCDLLLVDVVVPHMSGRQVADVIGRRYPGVPVLFMSGYSEGVLDSQGIVPAGVSLIQKPFSEWDLVEGVHRALARAGQSAS
jgi:two-component system, cell cycle sensor histidine kinase and response regulator CckA